MPTPLLSILKEAIPCLDKSSAKYFNELFLLIPALFPSLSVGPEPEIINATTPKSVTCTRTEYREEYIPGTKSNPGYVKSYEVDVVIPCRGESRAEKIDDNDCSEGSVIGGILGAGIALSSSRGKDRFWAVPAGGTAGALIGCQVDGG